jgi:hypothetical protein
MKGAFLAILAALALSAAGSGVSSLPVPEATAGQSSGAKTSSPAPQTNDLDRLLAPVALYPDALLGQMLMAAANPSKIGALSEWLRSQQTLKGTALQDAAKASGFDESCVALVLFPDVVETMANRLDWTTQVGKAFAADRSAVFASIQRLRTKARDAGKLKSTPQQEVETRTASDGQQVIVIEPANPQVVYVPQYNAQTVYTPTTTSTTVVVKEDDDADEAVAAGLIGFTAGIAIGAAMDNNYYYGPYGWRGGAYMYNDAWDDYYDHREDAREDWADHREDMVEERGDRASSAQEQRTERQQTRQDAASNRAEGTTRSGQAASARAEGTARSGQAASARAEGTARSGQAASASPSTSTASTARSAAESRGYSGDGTRTSGERSGTRSDAFSGYSSGKSERAASSRGQRSRSSSRGGGGSRRR